MPDIGAQHAGQNPFVFLPDGVLDRWYTARSKAAAGIVAVAGIGDSILRGGSATANSNRHFWALFVAALQARYGSAGEGLHLCTDTADAAYAVPSGAVPWATPCWTYTGTWSSSTFQRGLGGQCHTGTAGAVATGVFGGTGVDVIVGQASGGGPFSVTVDGQAYDKNGVQGGGAGNPTCLNATTTAGVLAVSIRGLAPGQHTIVLTNVSGQLILNGIVAYNGRASGVLPLQMGVAGKSLGAMLLSRTTDNALCSVLCAPTTAYGNAAGATWLPASPMLVVVEHGINDMQQAIPFGRFHEHLSRIGAAAQQGGAVVVYVIATMGPVWGWTNTQYAHEYVNKVYQAARRFGWIVLDMNAAWESLSSGAAAGMIAGGGNYHWSDAGHADCAGRLVSLLV